MTWQQRLRALVLAGGALAGARLVGGCGDDGVGNQASGDMTITGDLSYSFGCNGNPDPCCLSPNRPQCARDGGAD